MVELFRMNDNNSNARIHSADVVLCHVPVDNALNTCLSCDATNSLTLYQRLEAALNWRFMLHSRIYSDKIILQATLAITFYCFHGVQSFYRASDKY